MSDPRIQRAEQLSIGMAAASALIVVACLSGLPSASCTAIAETYLLAITGFGTSAFSGIWAFMIIVRRPVHSYSDLLANRTFLIAAFVIFLMSTMSGIHNLKIATQQCFFGESIQFQARQHERIALIDPFDFMTLGRLMLLGFSN